MGMAKHPFFEGLPLRIVVNRKSIKKQLKTLACPVDQPQNKMSSFLSQRSIVIKDDLPRNDIDIEVDQDFNDVDDLLDKKEV